MTRRAYLIAAAAGVLVLSYAVAAAAQDSAPMREGGQQDLRLGQTGLIIPGLSVRSKDGSQLGQIEHVDTTASGEQTLHIRTPDGKVKAVPGAGAIVRDGVVAVEWTTQQFMAAPSVGDRPIAHPMPSLPPEPAPDNEGPPTMPRLKP